jgi:hypothetical protein
MAQQKLQTYWKSHKLDYNQKARLKSVGMGKM